jgi:aminomethyltransferase
VGIEIDWTEVERLFEAAGLPPAVSPIASRVAVPIYKNGNQIGKATSTTWSPLLKRMIALGTVQSDFAKPGTKIEIEITVEAVRHRVGAIVAKTPFYNPKHKTATPIT